jgi:hypothetical protein
MVRAWLMILISVAAACGEAPSQAAAPIKDPSGDEPRCARARCGDPDARNILFPGNPACGDRACERGLADKNVYIPPRNGEPWGDTHELGTDGAHTLAGYSSGRIALLRRLALIGDGKHAVMIDPSADDGRRDFTGRGPERGEDIVRAWLREDRNRTFLLIYSPHSTGWSRYAALQTTDVGERVKVCTVDAPHLDIPSLPGLRDALVNPKAWDNGTCRWGSAGGTQARTSRRPVTSRS